MYLLVEFIGSKSHDGEESIAVHGRTPQPVGGELAVKDTHRSIFPLQLETLKLHTGQHVPEDDKSVMTGREKDPGVTWVGLKDKHLTDMILVCRVGGVGKKIRINTHNVGWKGLARVYNYATSYHVTGDLGEH